MNKIRYSCGLTSIQGSVSSWLGDTSQRPIPQMSIQGYFWNYTNGKYGSGSRILIHPSKCVLCWAWKRAKSGERWPAPTRQIPVRTVQRGGSVWITTNNFFPFYIDFFSSPFRHKKQTKKKKYSMVPLGLHRHQH